MLTNVPTTSANNDEGGSQNDKEEDEDSLDALICRMTVSSTSCPETFLAGEIEGKYSSSDDDKNRMEVGVACKNKTWVE